jgi:hypothetical protein
VATVRRLITYSGSEEWIKQTLSHSLLPKDGVITFKNKARIAITTIRDPSDSEGVHIKFKEVESG